MSTEQTEAAPVNAVVFPELHVFLKDDGMDTYVIEQWRDWVKYKLGEDSDKLSTVDKIFNFAKIGVRRNGRKVMATMAEVSGLLRKLADQMSPE